jgi:hypothetical protein
MVLAASALLLSSSAWADQPPADAPPPAAAPAAARPQQTRSFARLATPSLNHVLQFGLSVMPGTGYRGIFPYEENINCGQADKRVCTTRLPFFVDVQPSFGISAKWDVLVDLRFGIEKDFTQSRQFAVAPGFRYWVDPELPVKFYATIQVAYDTTDQNNQSITNNDIAVRNANGVMFEVMRNVGFFLQFGETIGFRRWLRFEVDAGMGVQARFP